MMSVFYDRFERACKDAGTSPTALTLKIGLSKGNASSWKKGGYPSVEVLRQISSELNVSIDYLLGREIDPETKNAPQKVGDGLMRVVASGGDGVALLKRTDDIPDEGSVRVSLAYSSGYMESYDVDEDAVPAILSVIKLAERK